jgi:hypothetical protein
MKGTLIQTTVASTNVPLTRLAQMGETGGECHEIACDRRHPRGRNASLAQMIPPTDCIFVPKFASRGERKRAQAIRPAIRSGLRADERRPSALIGSYPPTTAAQLGDIRSP